VVNPLARIRAEYGERPSEVIRGYARMGYSQSFTAEMLSIQRKTLQGYCRRFGIVWPPRSSYRPECKGRGKGRPKGCPPTNPRRYSDAELLAAVSSCPVWQEFERREGPSASTVQRRFGSWRRAVALARRAA
jgi:hypothetical protein